MQSILNLFGKPIHAVGAAVGAVGAIVGFVTSGGLATVENAISVIQTNGHAILAAVGSLWAVIMTAWGLAHKAGQTAATPPTGITTSKSS